MDLMDCIESRIEFLKEKGYHVNLPVLLVELTRAFGEFPSEVTIWSFLLMLCGMVSGYECGKAGAEPRQIWNYLERADPRIEET